MVAGILVCVFSLLSEVVVDKQAFTFCNSVMKMTPPTSWFGTVFPEVGTDGVSVSSREYFRM